MTMTLFGTQGSGSAAVEIALARCGLAYENVRASSWEADSAQAALLKANPLGQIPTLVLDDGTVLSESAAILIHLGLAHPASALLPADASARAMSIRGLVFIAANCYAAIGVIDYPERFSEADAASAKAVHDGVRAATRRRLHRCWEMFADTFPAKPWLAGAEPGALDFLAVIVSRWAGTRAHLRKHRPDFFALLERIEAQAPVAPVVARHWPG